MGVVEWVAIIGLLVIAWVAIRREGRKRTSSNGGLWHMGDLAYAERTFRSKRNRVLARVDRAYRKNGQIELVELKTRQTDQVYDTDVIEMSVQRLALQDERGEKVSQKAWVEIANEDGAVRTVKTIRLLEEQELVPLIDRAFELSDPSGSVDLKRLRGPRSTNACRKCGHRRNCPQRLA
jgi:hypothetical protein